jgi:hypothetical protein
MNSGVRGLWNLTEKRIAIYVQGGDAARRLAPSYDRVINEAGHCLGPRRTDPEASLGVD